MFAMLGIIARHMDDSHLQMRQVGYMSAMSHTLPMFAAPESRQHVVAYLALPHANRLACTIVHLRSVVPHQSDSAPLCFVAGLGGVCATA
jgi:hypothetical protein